MKANGQELNVGTKYGSEILFNVKELSKIEIEQFGYTYKESTREIRTKSE